jgi:Lon protease-like protein
LPGCPKKETIVTDLPTIIPIFPLPNVVLFPNIMLPLHIFEPRYRQMVRDTMGKERRLIGMALLKGDWQQNYKNGVVHGSPEIFSIGCVGEMVRMVPLPDGRSNILLQGVREYRVREEIFAKSYREAVVEWLQPMPKDSLPKEQRAELSGLFEAYLGKQEAVHKFTSDPTIGDEFFINFFAFHLDLLPLEKQSLLEAETLGERAERLRDILDFKMTAGHWGGKEPQDPGKRRVH